MREKKMRAKLEDFLQEVCEKTITNNQYPVLTSSKSGLFLQSDYFNKQVASKDNTGYKIIRRGQFTYRAMSDTGEFFPNMLEGADVGIVSPAYPVFEIIKQDQIVPEYLNYYFKSNRFQNSISTFAQGSTRTSVKFGKLKKVSIELPEIKKQYQIIRTLDLLRTIINNRKKEVLELDELIRARFVEMFGDLANPECKWNKYPLINACSNKDDIKCGPFGTQLSKDEYTAEGIAVWEIPQINMGFQCAPTHFLTEEKANQLEAYSLIPGDIAMSRKGNVGKCALFPEKYSNGIIHSDVLRIRVDKKIVNPVFMMYQLHFSKAVTRQIELVSSGAIMAGVNVTKLKQICVHIPPIELQQQFATFVAAIDKSKATVQKALDETQLLFDSLMQQYFG